MPLDLGPDTPRLLPALRLVAKAGKVAADLARRSPDRALEQIAAPFLQDPIRRQPDCMFAEILSLIGQLRGPPAPA